IADAATAALIATIGEALEDDRWCGPGFVSIEHWAGLRFGLSRARARRYVSIARVMHRLPLIAAAFAAGELSECHLAVIARADVPPERDREVCDFARTLSLNQLTRLLAHIPPTPEPAAPPSDAPDAPDAPTEETAAST